MKFSGTTIPRDPLLPSERTQGFAADPVYVKGEVFAYVGLPQNLKDLKPEPSQVQFSGTCTFQGRVWIYGGCFFWSDSPEALIPEPYTLHPQPETRNTKP